MLLTVMLSRRACQVTLEMGLLKVKHYFPLLSASKSSNVLESFERSVFSGTFTSSTTYQMPTI